ncbi:MAG: segregation/condensation protein A [Spirochaetia bacterium]|nr:segregation/condensation protein A [Spirochaetia bacterium]
MIQALQTTDLFKVQFSTIEGNFQEGPLGLLWRLIESYEVDIFQVSLSRITGDFIQYIKGGLANLDEEAEFALMASKLLFYKSRLLLPNPGFEDEHEPDYLPFELVDQLLEYKKFQMAADALKSIEEKTRLSYNREPSWREFEENLDLFEVDLVSFLKTFKEFLSQAEKKNPYEIENEEVSMDQVLEDMTNKIISIKSMSFFDYIKNFSLNKMIVAFLAVLELLKSRMIKVIQSQPFDDIKLIFLEKKEMNA